MLFTGDFAQDQVEVRSGDKQLLVYGLHECGGMSRTMAALWRAAGYLGYQEPSPGHSNPRIALPRWRRRLAHAQLQSAGLPLLLEPQGQPRGHAPRTGDARLRIPAPSIRP